MSQIAAPPTPTTVGSPSSSAASGLATSGRATVNDQYYKYEITFEMSYQVRDLKKNLKGTRRGETYIEGGSFTIRNTTRTLNPDARGTGPINQVAFGLLFKDDRAVCRAIWRTGLNVMAPTRGKYCHAPLGTAFGTNGNPFVAEKSDVLAGTESAFFNTTIKEDLFDAVKADLERGPDYWVLLDGQPTQQAESAGCFVGPGVHHWAGWLIVSVPEITACGPPTP